MPGLTYVTSVDLNNEANFSMSMPEFKKASEKVHDDSSDLGFNAVADYNTGLIIQKTLAAATTSDQLDPRSSSRAS